MLTTNFGNLENDWINAKERHERVNKLKSKLGFKGSSPSRHGATNSHKLRRSYSHPPRKSILT